MHTTEPTEKQNEEVRREKKAAYMRQYYAENEWYRQYQKVYHKRWYADNPGYQRSPQHRAAVRKSYRKKKEKEKHGQVEEEVPGPRCL